MAKNKAQPENKSILEVLKFVKGGVSRREQLPVLQHFCIQNGEIQSGNGIISLSSPIQLALDCNPLAAPFISAIGACESLSSVPAFSMQNNGRLRMVAGKFRVNIDCTPEAFPHINPEGSYIELQPGLLKAFQVLEPMVGEDASRPWARGVLIRDGSAYATNNVVIGQYWLGWKFSFDINVPDECIREIIRVKTEPCGISASDRSITFFYKDGRWIRSQLLTTVWPSIEPVLDRPSSACALPADFYDALTYLEPYCDQHRSIYFPNNHTLSTHLQEDQGATFELATELSTADIRGRYNIDQLRRLEGLASICDWTLFPAPALFYGTGDLAQFRGAIVGMKEL